MNTVSSRSLLPRRLSKSSTAIHDITTKKAMISGRNLTIRNVASAPVMEWLAPVVGYDIPMSSSFLDFNRNLIKDLRANGGKATSGPFKGRDVLILTTRGAKSASERENPLVYTRDGDHYVVVASKGGAPMHPSWFHNLVKHPEAP